MFEQEPQNQVKQPDEVKVSSVLQAPADLKPTDFCSLNRRRYLHHGCKDFYHGHGWISTFVWKVSELLQERSVTISDVILSKFLCWFAKLYIISKEVYWWFVLKILFILERLIFKTVFIIMKVMNTE